MTLVLPNKYEDLTEDERDKLYDFLNDTYDPFKFKNNAIVGDYLLADILKQELDQIGPRFQEKNCYKCGKIIPIDRYASYINCAICGAQSKQHMFYDMMDVVDVVNNWLKGKK